MQSDHHELRHALSELRFSFHRALAGRFRSYYPPDDRELRRLIAREPDERKIRALMARRPVGLSRWRTLMARFLGWWR
jgi:hypothetical protein